MTLSVRQFVHQQNLERYRKLLARAANDVDRELLQKLINEEQRNDPPIAPDCDRAQTVG
jgi:hypothetical protein